MEHKSKYTVGTIFYFVDTELGKIITHTLMPEVKGDFFINGRLDFTGKKTINEQHFYVDPKPSRYFISHSKFWNNKKGYLVFTDEHKATKALTEYVLPNLIANEQLRAEDAKSLYMKYVKSIQNLETKIKQGKSKLKTK
jgi:hypothetical protein